MSEESLMYLCALPDLITVPVDNAGRDSFLRVLMAEKKKNNPIKSNINKSMNIMHVNSQNVNRA